MTKHLFKLFAFGCAILIGFSACSSSDDAEEIGGKTVNKISGLVEKGPFVAGATVTVYELDKNLNGTGKVFTTTTDESGAFALNTSVILVSEYVKIVVDGFYFNEYTGRLSDSKITLEAITKLDSDKANINVNVLTHLESPRVLALIKEKKIDFEAAKVQAEKELLEAFLIKDKTIVPEQISITDNNTSANVLIAISSILLNERSDAEFTEFMSALRTDFGDGVVSDATKKKIADSSLGLNYTTIKQNIIERYKTLGKDVTVGEFELFIDGDGDGEIGEGYEENPRDNVMTDEYFLTSEANVKHYFNSTFKMMDDYALAQHVFDGVYTNTIALEDVNVGYLREVSEHHLNSHQPIHRELWQHAYRSVRAYDFFIEKSKESTEEWLKPYQYYARAFRAYNYLNLVEYWGDVCVLPAIANVNEVVFLERKPADDVLKHIISELEEIEPFLPAQAVEGFYSKYFVQALLMRTYLHKKDYSNALKYADKIIDSGMFALATDYNSIFVGSGVEGIFGLVNKPSEGGYSDAYMKLTSKGKYMPLVRYTEVVLSAAEANLELGKSVDAVQHLNMVRARNGKVELGASADLESALLEEWKGDLYNEGVWFTTLKRFGKAEEALDLPSYQLLLPIPQSELDQHPKMTQNPGYLK